MPSPLPRRNHRAHVIQRLVPPLRPDGGGLPHYVAGSASALKFSRPARRSLTLRPACSRSCSTALSVESFNRLVARATVSTATGCNDYFPDGTLTRKTPTPFLTAHDTVRPTPPSAISGGVRATGLDSACRNASYGSPAPLKAGLHESSSLRPSPLCETIAAWSVGGFAHPDPATI